MLISCIQPLGLSTCVGKTERITDPVPPQEEDLSIETLTSDLINLVRVVFPDIETAPSLLVCRSLYTTLIIYEGLISLDVARRA